MLILHSKKMTQTRIKHEKLTKVSTIFQK